MTKWVQRKKEAKLKRKVFIYSQTIEFPLLVLDPFAGIELGLDVLCMYIYAIFIHMIIPLKGSHSSLQLYNLCVVIGFSVYRRHGGWGFFRWWMLLGQGGDTRREINLNSFASFPITIEIMLFEQKQCTLSLMEIIRDWTVSELSGEVCDQK